MTYFHINLDPRGKKKKKSFSANSYTRGYIFSLFVVAFFFSFLMGLLTTHLQGGIWETVLQLLRLGFRFCRPAGGLLSPTFAVISFVFNLVVSDHV